MLWTGWVFSALPVLLLVMSGFRKSRCRPKWCERIWRHGLAKNRRGHWLVELACTVIYLIPQTAVLGAILLTGYLGGATATHVRIADTASSWSRSCSAWCSGWAFLARAAAAVDFTIRHSDRSTYT